jgi:hypothetical protein
VILPKTLNRIKMKYDIKKINIKDVRAGDTVVVGGELKTVCKKDILRGFMGVTLFGDSYRLGSLPVTVALNLKG